MTLNSSAFDVAVALYDKGKTPEDNPIVNYLFADN